MTYHSLSMVWGCLGGTGHPRITLVLDCQDSLVFDKMNQIILAC